MGDKRNDPLSVAHLDGNLKYHTSRSTFVTVATQVLKFGLQLLSVTLLSRLVTPADFGVVAMVTVCLGFFTSFKDGGLSAATIHQRVLIHSQVSNLFWINVSVGVVIFLLAAALAPLISFIYEEPDLAKIAIAISSIFIVGGVTVQHEALLRRQMRFKTLASIDLTSMALGTTVGIVLGVAGKGYWALVSMPIVTAVVQAILCSYASGWSPSWIDRSYDVRPMLRFGFTVTGANLVGYLASSTTTFIIGLVGGAQQLGLYNRASTLALLPTSQILPPVMNVAQPALARVANDAPVFAESALKLISKMAFFGLSVAVIMQLMADWIILVFLGEEWSAAIVMFRLLAVFALVEPLASVIAIILISAGKPQVLLKTKVISLIAIIVSAVASFSLGTTAVIAAFALSGLLVRTPMFIWLACRNLPFSQGDVYRAIAPFLMASLITLLVGFGIRTLLRDLPAVQSLILFTPSIFITYLVSCFCLAGARAQVIDTCCIIQRLFRDFFSKYVARRLG